MNQPRNQTAVEWLFTNLFDLVFSKETTSEDYRKCLEQAKAMENEQINQKITFPTDKEIKEEADLYHGVESYNATFVRGAQWMRDKIKGGEQ